MRLLSTPLVGLLFTVACADIREPETRIARSAIDRVAACEADPRVITGVVSVSVCVGADLFFREEFGGNGRSCATCHPVDNNFTIDKEFIATRPPDDPLFVPIDGLEDPVQLRARGLILENVDGFDPASGFVLRSVPHNLSMGVSVTRSALDPVNPPAERTGWSGDGAPGTGTLREFQNGAITQHYPKSLARVEGVDFRLATSQELDDIELFMRKLGRTNELLLAAVVMSDLRADLGRLAFLTAGCNVCHDNAGANAAVLGGNSNFDTGVEDSRNHALVGYTRDGGFLRGPNPAGGFGDGTFNVTPLVEAADTGPFFHTDTTVSGASAHNTLTATTIEEAVAFYDTPAFNSSPAGQVVPINLTAAQIDNIGRFLRVVNAAFNAQLALKRLDAAVKIVSQFGDQHVDLQRELLRLADVELDDALEVLGGQANLNIASQQALARGRDRIEDARAAQSASARRAATLAAIQEVASGNSALGLNLSFAIGEGTVMF